MKVEHGAVLVMSRRQPSAEDVDELAVWCGGCCRFLPVELPHQTAEGVLAEHQERVHGQMSLFLVVDAWSFQGPEWDAFGGCGA